jgi:hypothetical protein
MRERRLTLAIVAVALMALAWRHPTANIEILAQDHDDLSPHHVQAALDTGLVAVSVLVTWTSGHLSHR